MTLSLADIAKACHLRADDTAFALAELGFLRYRRVTTGSQDLDDDHDLGEWKDVEVVISREMVDGMWSKWRVREEGMLSEKYVLL